MASSGCRCVGLKAIKAPEHTCDSLVNLWRAASLKHCASELTGVGREAAELESRVCSPVSRRSRDTYLVLLQTVEYRL